MNAFQKIVNKIDEIIYTLDFKKSLDPGAKDESQNIT